ncbi:MAG: site-specific integrase [Nocardia sp.]|uniref:tyrosine-type recombinase/integrase n=1 Tax=Nocardia sp. TaxID=1821 RepID=UPI00262CA076|nr:site-specific integrase [Nocardia sp.]MCU1646728.1 site-specific integrase [Nocardia sp.]
MAHIQKRTTGKTVAYVVRWTDPAGVERSESFSKRGRYDIPGTAEHYKHQLQTKIAQGIYVDPDLARVPLKVEVDKWVERAHTQGTRDARRNFAKNLGLLAATPIGEIRPSDIRDWLDHLTRGRSWHGDRALGENTVALQFQFLTTVLKIAVDDSILVSNPCKKVKAPPRPDTAKASSQLLTIDQVWSLIENTNRQTGCMLLLTAQTGLRPSEVAGLRVCDVDFLHRRIHVVQQANHDLNKPPTSRLKTRTSKRTIPLPRETHDALSSFLTRVTRERDDVLFRTKFGNIWCVGSMADVFRYAAKKADVPAHFSWHSLRHFYASALIEKGASVRTVQARLGHATPDITLRVYTHLWPDNDTHTLDAIDGIFAHRTG